MLADLGNSFFVDIAGGVEQVVRRRGLVQVLNEAPGFAVPTDVAVTGYDDNHFASESSVPISTVAQPGEEMGHAAADLLLDRIENPASLARTVTLEPRLIPRSSTLGNAWRRD